MAEQTVRVRMMVGAYRYDLEHHPDKLVPYVLGALDESTWEVMDDEADGHHWGYLKRELTMDDGAEYEWREVMVEIDLSELRRLVTQTPVVKGKVSEPNDVV